MTTLADTSSFNASGADALEPTGPRPNSISSNAAANWLRWLGAFAVAGSAVVFLLQGLNNVDLELRNWVYLVLMAVMGGCGVASQKFMQDAKGARLFFGLAALLVPVQFAQLAGLLHELSNVAGSGVPQLLWLITGTVLLSAPLAYAGMAILARNDKRLLTSTLLLMSGALLIPERDSIIGFVTLGVIAASTVWLELKVFRNNSRYASWDGLGLRVLLAAPFIIAAVRMSMHIDSIAGGAAMAGVVAVLLSRLHHLHESKGWVQVLGAAMGVASWWAYASESMPAIVDGDFGFCLLMVPSSLWLMDIGRLSRSSGRHYRFAASLLWAAAASSLLLHDGGAMNALIALLLGVIALVWGATQSQRQPAIAGLLICVPSLVVLLAESLHSVEVNAWIGLGVAGIALVFSASLVEKYGRPLLTRSQKVWHSMSAWD